MSDFLTHIATKNHSLTAEVQPRVASLFEPVPSMSKFSKISWDANETHDIVTHNEIMPELSGATVQPSVRSYLSTNPAQHENQSPISNEAEPSNFRPLGFSPHILTNLNRSRFQVEMDPDEAKMSSGSRSEQLLTDAAIEPPKIVPISLEEPINLNAGKPQPLPLHQSSEPNFKPSIAENLPMSQINHTNQSAQPKKEIDDKSPVGPEIRQQKPASQTKHTPMMNTNVMGTIKPYQAGHSNSASYASTVLAKPIVRPYIEPADEQRTKKPTTPPPTIQVTIGRIEVRATPPLPPASKPRPASSVMSLDEYLRRRQGGGA